MTNQEAYLSSNERRILKFIDQGTANAKIVAEEFGCVGPAFESFSDGLDRQAWSTAEDRREGFDYSPKLRSLLTQGEKPVYIVDEELTDPLGAQILRASAEHSLGMSEIESSAFSAGHYAAYLAFYDLPSYLEPGYDASNGPSFELLSSFYSPIAENLPEGENEKANLKAIHTSFAVTLANAALMLELEKRHTQGAIYVVNELEFANRAMLNLDPIPHETLDELISSRSLMYNQSFYEID